MAISTPSKTTNLFPDPLPDYEPPPRRRSGPRRYLAIGVVGEWVIVVMGAVLVALLIKTFLIQAFFIPSESMKPTLEIGDRVLVNKMSYHLHPINRGDVVVFERLDGDGASDDEVKDLIKRVIALPGETVVFKDNKVYIDGKRLDEPYLPANTPSQPASAGQVNWDHRCTTDDPCKIPPDTVWVMGDNRTNSRDSRYIGPIPDSKIVGRAFSIVWPFPRASGL